MNSIDFNTTPAGFPLESDAILGQMQTNLTEVLTVLGQMMELPASGYAVVLSGCVVTGSSMTDGWILLNNGGVYEIFFFEGGSVQTSYIVDESAVSKNNQDGTPIDRIYTRKVVYGTGTGSFLTQNIYRYNSISDNVKALVRVAKGGLSDWTGWILIQGFGAVSGGSGGIGAGVALYNGKLVVANAYGSAVSSGSPVYLKSDGSWTASLPGTADYTTFNPYNANHLKCFHRKANFPIGGLMPIKSAAAEVTAFFDGTGLGYGEWSGWALANGNNSTLNLSSEIASVSWIQRMS